jgi:hypothetical protein
LSARSVDKSLLQALLHETLLHLVLLDRLARVERLVTQLTKLRRAAHLNLLLVLRRAERCVEPLLL